MPVSASVDDGLRVRLRRRWRICVVGLLATIGLCVAAATLVPATYVAKGLVLLTPPPTTTGPNAQVNPYLALSNLQPLADVLGRVMTDPASVVALRAAGFRGSFTVVRDISTNGPILDVGVNSSTSLQAVEDLKLVLDSAAPALEQLQASESVGVSSRAAAQVVASDLEASPSTKSQTRALLVAAVLGIGGTVLVAVGVDNFALRRRTGRRGDDGGEKELSELPAKPRPRPMPRSRPRPRPYTAPLQPLSELPGEPARTTPSDARSARAGSTAAVVAEPVVAEYAAEPEHANTSGAGASSGSDHRTAVDAGDDMACEIEANGSSDLPAEARAAELLLPPAQTRAHNPNGMRPGVRALVRARMNRKHDLAESPPSANFDEDRAEVSVAAAGQGDASPDG